VGFFLLLNLAPNHLTQRDQSIIAFAFQNVVEENFAEKTIFKLCCDIKTFIDTEIAAQRELTK
jgi:hypothetical protein